MRKPDIFVIVHRFNQQCVFLDGGCVDASQPMRRAGARKTDLDTYNPTGFQRRSSRGIDQLMQPQSY